MPAESAIVAAPRACNVLLIYPRFAGGTFWNFAATCEVFGARYPAAPLGLITVAALLPSAWAMRLVDRNTEELSDGDLAWADLVMTGGMLPQQYDTLEIIDICRAAGKPVVVGGPGVTSGPHIYERADFRVLGEAESIIDKFIAAWEAGAREGVFEAEKFQADVTKSPIPRFDLLKFDHYLHVGVQFSRGCPFTCEFCDIIELYGRVPRAKTNAQMLAELEALYRLGYRGHVDFVDDNLIGNKKAVRSFLLDLRTWLDEHDYPFEFTTEASVNLADDTNLLRVMNEANFVGVFVGIESPDPETLIMAKKKQNTRRSLVESIHKIYAAGLFVHAGFIVGFDSEKDAVADTMIALIEDAAIPVCMVGLLYALPNTQPAHAPARARRPPLSRARCDSQGQCGSVHPRSKLRDAAAEAGDPARLQARPGEDLRPDRVCRPSPPPLGPARQFRTKAPNPSRRCSAQVRRYGNPAPDHRQPARAARLVLADILAMPHDQPALDTLDRRADGAVYPLGAVLALRHRTDREKDRRDRARWI